MATLEMQTSMSLTLIKEVAEQNKIPLQQEIDGSNVAEIMLSLIDEETSRLRAIQATKGRSTLVTKLFVVASMACHVI